MKRRFVVFVLTLVMLLGHVLSTGIMVFAEGEEAAIKNSYGHAITYEPVEHITTGGTAETDRIKLFDAGYSAWTDPKAKQNEAESLKWLADDNYLLNRFAQRVGSGRKLKGFDENGIWEHYFKLKSNNHEVKKWDVTLAFPKLTSDAERRKGNLHAIYDKGDLEYFFTCKVKTVQTSWWGKPKASNDTGTTEILGRYLPSRGDGWDFISALSTGGPDFNDSYGWKSAEKLNTLYFKAESDVDDQVDSWFSGGMLVARDKHGPKISSLKITSDSAGNNPINGPITFDTINWLKTLNSDGIPTIYFQVEWDEPVVLSGMTNDQIEAFKLEIKTVGIDNTTSTDAKASFLEFKPTPTTAKPVMVFEYQILDPYGETDPVKKDLATKRGYFYKFACVNVSSSENQDIWNHVRDLSGNRFNAEVPNEDIARIDTAYFPHSAWVDIQPFGIERAGLSMFRTNNGSEDKTMFVRQWQYLYIDICFNKLFASSVQEADYPKITLNVTEDGVPVTLTAIARWKEEGGKKEILSYCFDSRWDRDYVMDGEFIKVREISFDPSKFKDVSGYSFMNYSINESTGVLTPQNMPLGTEMKIGDYSPSPNKRYKIDYTPPTVSLGVDEFDYTDPKDHLTYKIIKAEATIDEAVSLFNSDVAFTVKINGNMAEGAKLGYMDTTSGDWSEAAAEYCSPGSLTASFSSPLSQGEIVYGTRTTYGLIKLPITCEADSIEVSVSVTDEAGNVGSKTQTFSAISTPAWAGYDNMAPRLKASVDREVIDLVIDDVDDIVSYKYGYSDSDTVEPTYGPKASGKACTILAPAGLTENKVYEKVVWIKAKDSNGHESEALKVPVDYDRSFTEIRLNNPEATNDTYWLGEEHPTANITILNGSSYFYFWAEKPAVADPAAAYKEAFISSYGAYARDGKAVLQALEGEFEEHPYNTTHINVAMTAGTKVIKIEDGEYYGGNVISPSESSRPIMLVVGVSKDFGTVVQNEYGQYLVYDWLIRTIEFDTVYSAPELDVTQTRFSTCNSAGQRVDYVRNADGKGLVWPNDINPATGARYSYPINTPSLFGFAQAEFSIAPDPATGFERADMDNSYITLEKVYYLGNTMWDADETKAREEVGRWKFSDLQLTNSPDGSKTVIVDFDPSIVSHEYAEIGPDRYGDDTVLPVRYEFAINMRYISDGTHVIPQTKTAIAHYAFCEMPTGFVEAVVEDNEDYNKTTDFDDQYGYTPKNVEAVFDENGNDITSSIPVYTVQTDYFEAQKENAYLRFSGPQGRYSTSDIAYFTSPVMNEPGSDKVDQNNTVKLKLYIGTNPNGPFDVLEFTHDYDRYFGSGLYDIGQHLFDNDKSKVKEVTLYYKFVHPERGTETPLYVLKLRRDNVAPIFDIYVSETEREVGEVLLKLKSLTDTQTMPDGTVLIDTPEVALISPRTNLFGDVIYPFEAWRKPTADDNLDAIPNEDKLNGMGFEYMDGQEVAYIRVKPDEGGLYHFTSKGFFRTDVYDNAGNSNDYVLINGKSVSPTNEGLESGGPRYYINNVDTDPPTFDTAPTVTAGNGKFTISAKADETVSNVYLKFDDAYTELLLGTTTAGAVPQGVFAVNGIDEDNLKSVPGMISGGFNAESGEISAEIYVKYSDSSPAVLLRSVTVIIEKPSGRRTEYIHNFTTPVGGTKPEITNAKNADGYKEYKYGETLDFSVPVKLAGIEGDYAFSYSSDKLAFYSDGLVPVEYIDLFGERMLEEVYANICGTAFAHTLTFTANGNVITAQTPVSADVKVSIDVSKTPNLRVVGDSEFTFTENGTLSYTLNNLETATSRTFTVPILNIDKEAPEALVNFSSETELGVDDNGQTLLRYYSVTYSIVGFSEDDVTMIPDQEGGIAPSSVSFSIDTPEAQRVYTFRFRDSAGNIGTYTADASGIEFSQRLDRTITGYRLTYQTPAGNTFRSIGEFESSDPVSEIKLGLVNNAVSVRIEALNVSGKLVPCTIVVNGALPDGASVYAKEKLVIFSTESSEERVVNLTLSGVLAGNTLNVPVVLPANTIDLSAPSGKIKYEVDPDNADNIRAYLETEASDLAENGVYLTGTMIDGTPFKMEEDATRGYYVTLHVNGAGKFVLLDKAGNIGTVPIGVFSIDKDAPVYLGEAWQGTSNITSTGIMDEATKQLIKELIETPTNSSISLFIRFNEQLSGAKVQAFTDVGDVTELTPTANYVVVETGNNSITVEFKQNCRAKLTVYDLKRNATTLWRPEDGPVSGIDKKAPVLEGGAPTRNVANNMVTLIYSFDEPVMLLQESKKIAEGQYDQGHKDGYKKEHTITFKENGTKFLSFTDEAGNVFSDYPLITEIDDEGPTIGHSIDFVGDGKNLSADEAYVAGGWFTSKDVRILLDIHDNKSLDSEITVKVETMTKSAQEDDPGFELKKEDVKDVKDDFASNEITGDVYHDYNYNLVISRNGFYRVIAKDSFGNENAAEFNISMIDKSGPLIRISGGTLFFEVGGTAEALKTAIAKNVEVVDLQSGANKPLELAPDPNDPNRVDAYKESLIAQIGEGVSMDIDVSGVNLNKPGSYSAIITAEDRLDNISEKKYSVFVVKELYVFEVNGRSVYSGDTIALKLGNIAITDPSPTAKYYYAKETKTEAQMKYAEEFDPLTGFEASEKGYYTIIAKDSGRKTYILYVHAK